MDKVADKLADTPTRYTAAKCWDETGCPDDCVGCAHGLHEKRLSKPCSHAPGFHEPSGVDLDESIRFFGLRRSASGAYEYKPESRSHTIPKRERQNIAACAAAGLSYWSEAPGVNQLWAVDDRQQAHEVTIDRRHGTVRFENRESYHVETATWSAAA